MTNSVEQAKQIDGNFPLHASIIHSLPQGTNVLSADSSGVSSWTRTAKISVIKPDGSPTRYFLKCASGKGAQAMTEGEYHSLRLIASNPATSSPKPVSWGKYQFDGQPETFFVVSTFHDMDLETAPDPARFAAHTAAMHDVTSPNGKFGFEVTTACGRVERTVAWESSWAVSFSHLFRNAFEADIATNGSWPAFDLAYNQMLELVIPRLLGALQSDGRHIRPALVHGDFWEHNIGIDRETGQTIIFDPGCVFGHNEFDFGIWRCFWTTYFTSPAYLEAYQQLVKPSEPAEEWDDRNRLYSIWIHIIQSAGHPGSQARPIAFNDMLYLCEKYAPVEGLPKYDREHDINVTGRRTAAVIHQMEE